MSIIHDALKKIQQGQTPKASETPEVKTLPPRQNKIKPVLALLCAVVIILWSFGSFYKQLHAYFPKAKKLAKSSFYKLIHKEEIPNSKTKAPENLIPSAKLTVNPPKPLNPPKPSSPSSPTNLPAISNTLKPNVPQTLNIHGVMSNGPNNLVLINDQVYQEGDDVDGVKIVKISLDSITVINNGKEEKIRVKN